MQVRRITRRRANDGKHLIARGNRLGNPRKIFVRAPNWVGDAVMSLPALEALRARFSDVETVVVAKPWVSEVYWHHPAISRQIIYDAEEEHRGPLGFRKLIRQLRAESFDVGILFQNAFHAAWMAWRAGIPVRVGYARDGRAALLTEAIAPPSPASYGHQVYYYLELLFRAGAIDSSQTTPEIHIELQESEKAWATERLEAMGLGGSQFLVGLSPGASFGPAKRWPPERCADLADRLSSALQGRALIFGSSAERLLAESVAERMTREAVVVAGETTLRQSMALMAECRLIVSNDSGPMHVAAALGLPVVAVFGSTSNRRTGPLSARARIVRHPVACSPCGLRKCPIDFRCMSGVTVDDVYRVALELVKQTGKC